MTNDKSRGINTLARAARRYNAASLQDKNPIISARHNAYAVALIDTLHEIATEEEVQQITGISLQKLRTEILAQQDKIEAQAFALLDILKKKGITLPELSDAPLLPFMDYVSMGVGVLIVVAVLGLIWVLR